MIRLFWGIFTAKRDEGFRFVRDSLADGFKSLLVSHFGADFERVFRRKSAAEFRITWFYLKTRIWPGFFRVTVFGLALKVDRI